MSASALPEAKPLVIEQGRAYRTRGGRKYVVACIVPPNPFTGETMQYPAIIGYIEGCRGVFMLEAGGREVAGHEHQNDLVAPWTEPRTETVIVALVRMEDGGTWRTIRDSGEELNAYAQRNHATILDQHSVTFTWQEPCE